MKKNYLNSRNCFKNIKIPLASGVFKRCAAVLLSASILSYMAIPIGAVNAETPSGGNNTGDNTINSPTVYKSIIYGDLNGDSKVNALDLAKMKTLFLGSPEGINTAGADLNGDKSVNALDLAILNKFLLGKINTFPVANTFGNTRDGSVIDVDLDGSFKIYLEENGSTGYLWNYSVSEENALNLALEESFSFSPDLVGAPIQKVLSFKALKPGKYTLLFTYSRPWETNTEPLKSIKCEIYVTTTNGTVINVNKGELFSISLKEGGFAGFSWTYSESEKNTFLLASKNSYYQYPGYFDAFYQAIWKFKALETGKHTLTFTQQPGGAIVNCEVNVQ